MSEPIDWSAVEHAYGEASNTPRILELLASESPSEREQGFYDLYGCLCHQGSVYPATLAALPRLLALVVTPGYGGRLELLEALGDIARGYGEGVDIAVVRRAFDPFAEKILAAVSNGTDAEKLAALGIFRGEELVSAAEPLAAIARTDASPAVRMAAWAALSYVAPAKLPESVDDAPDVVAALDLAHLRASDGPSPTLAGRVIAALSDRAVATRLERWAERAHVPAPLHATAKCLDAPDSPFAALVERCIVDSGDMMDATALAELLLDATFPRGKDVPRVDLGTVTARQRSALVALAQSDVVWGEDDVMNGNLLTALARHGLPAGFDVRAELFATFGGASLKRAVIVTPRQVPAAAEVASACGREAWLDVPFIFLANAEDELERAIPEDPADFTEEVMDDFTRIARPIAANVVRHTCPFGTLAFYPLHSPEELAKIARREGFEIVSPNLVNADEPYDDSDWAPEDDDNASPSSTPMALPPCLPFSELDVEVHAGLEAFATVLDAAGFSEVRPSLAATKTMGGAGIVVTPLAVARRFGDAWNVEIAFHCDAENGVFTRVAFVADEDEMVVAFRIFPKMEGGEFAPAFFEALASLDGNADPAVETFAAVSARIVVESDGVVREIHRARSRRW